MILLMTFLSRYQNHLETRMEASKIVFDSVQLFYYKCHKITFRYGGSYIDSRDWIKKQKNNKSDK